jgi:hypothetical protein
MIGMSRGVCRRAMQHFGHIRHVHVVRTPPVVSQSLCLVTPGTHYRAGCQSLLCPVYGTRIDKDIVDQCVPWIGLVPFQGIGRVNMYSLRPWVSLGLQVGTHVDRKIE